MQDRSKRAHDRHGIYDESPGISRGRNDVAVAEMLEREALRSTFVLRSRSKRLKAMLRPPIDEP
jgi:hypothetical protein